jgi:hypothetical protein
MLVEVVGATEKVRVECHWHGGVHTTHELTRPVARVASLSTYAALTGRAAELRREGLECARIAEILNAEGWRPAKRRNAFNAQMIHHLLLKSGAETINGRIPLFYATNTCALASHFALEEAGTAYDSRFVDFGTAEQTKPEHLMIKSENGARPALITIAAC